MSEPIKVLVIEDDPDDAALIQHYLRQPGSPEARLEVDCAGGLAEGIRRLKEESYDAVLIDLMLPDSHGIQTFLELQKGRGDVPILVMTGLEDVTTAVEAMRLGAQDYLVKGTSDARLLKRAIRYGIERKKLMDQLVRMEQLKAEVRERRRMDQLKDDLLNSVSHELRTPLTIVKGTIDNLREGLAGALPPAAKKMVELSYRNILRLSKLINNMLDLSRLESGKAKMNRSAMDVAALIREEVQEFGLYARQKGVIIEENLATNLPVIQADADMIAQVLSNLLDNAVRHASKRVTVGTDAARDGVHVVVSDDGEGIPRDKMKDLFNKFVQVQREQGGGGYKGTGLGLSICKEIIALHKGDIWVDSAPGHGAEFHFTLPVAGVPA